MLMKVVTTQEPLRALAGPGRKDNRLDPVAVARPA
jgi:hypothetical protein